MQNVVAQKDNVDELFRKLSLAKEDSTKVNILYGLSQIYSNSSRRDSGLVLANQGLDLAKSIKYKKGEMDGSLLRLITIWK